MSNFHKEPSLEKSRGRKKDRSGDVKLTMTEAAKQANLAYQYFSAIIRKGEGPRVVRAVNGWDKFVYKSDLEEWLSKRHGRKS